VQAVNGNFAQTSFISQQFTQFAELTSRPMQRVVSRAVVLNSMVLDDHVPQLSACATAAAKASVMAIIF
jgi:hypothetical protein